MFRTLDDPISPSIDLNGNVTKTFAKANGAESFRPP